MNSATDPSCMRYRLMLANMPLLPSLLPACGRYTPRLTAAWWRAYVSASCHRASDRMPDPEVGLEVDAAIEVAVDHDGRKGPGHDVGTRVGEVHSGPALPGRDAAFDVHGLVSRPDDRTAEGHMPADPGVEWRAVSACPGRVARDRHQRVLVLARGSHRGDEVAEAALARELLHRAEHEVGGARAAVGRDEQDVQGRERVRAMPRG